jgi:hypothetical protein
MAPQKDPANMTGNGLEEWPHITLLYGIAGVPISEVVEQVRRLGAIDVTFGQSSVFAKGFRQSAEQAECHEQERKKYLDGQLRALKVFAKSVSQNAERVAQQGAQTLGVAAALTQAIEQLNSKEPQPVIVNVPEQQPPVVQVTPAEQPVSTIKTH